MIDWQVGQQLVCVIGFPLAKQRGYISPEVGDVVTIRKIAISFQKSVVCLFEEIPDQLLPDGTIGSFNAKNFRPVKPTSLDCFQYHLIRAPDLELTK